MSESIRAEGFECNVPWDSARAERVFARAIRVHADRRTRRRRLRTLAAAAPFVLATFVMIFGVGASAMSKNGSNSITNGADQTPGPNLLIQRDSAPGDGGYEAAMR